MRIPKHIGIIPDGNRRWASQAGLEKKDGYVHGLTPGLELLRLARQAGVEEITYYGFTTDNCGRPQEQVRAFSAACVEAVKLIAAEPVSLLVIGNAEAAVFPKELLPYTGARADLNGGGIRVNFLVNYGWEWDLSALYDGKKNGKLIENLHSSDISRIDLVIRWGGMRRLSGFLPVQAVYADFYVVDSLWPDAAQRTVDAQAERLARCGNPFRLAVPDGVYRIYAASGEFLLLAQVTDGTAVTIKSFFEVS